MKVVSHLNYRRKQNCRKIVAYIQIFHQNISIENKYDAFEIVKRKILDKIQPQ